MNYELGSGALTSPSKTGTVTYNTMKPRRCIPIWSPNQGGETPALVASIEALESPEARHAVEVTDTLHISTDDQGWKIKMLLQ